MNTAPGNAVAKSKSISGDLSQKKAMPEGNHPPRLPADPPFNLEVTFRLGKRYLAAHRWLVAAYVVTSFLCRPVIPVTIALLFSQLTNFFESQKIDQVVHEQQLSANFNAVLSKEGNGAGAAKKENAGAPADPVRRPSSAQDKLLRTYLLWLVLTLILVCGMPLQRYLVSVLDGKIGNAIPRDVFDSVLRQSPGFFFKYDADRLTVVVNQLCIQAQLALRQLLIDPILQVVSLGLVGFTLYSQMINLQRHGGSNLWLFFGPIAAFAIFATWLVTVMGRHLQRGSSAVQEKNLALATLVGGAVGASEEVQAMRAEGIFGQKHAKLLGEALESRIRQSLTLERLNVLNSAPGEVVLACLIGLAVFLVLSGREGNPGSLIAIALITPQFMSTIQTFSGLTINARMTWPSVALVNSILNSPSDIAESPNAKAFEQIGSNLQALDIVFSYHPDRPRNVLNNVSFEIPAGKVTGLVARPGQGKTTFFRLALRFYDPQAGQILVGGIPVQDFTLSSLRRHIVLMSQFPAFFHDSVRENFLVAKPDATDPEIRLLSEHTSLWPILVNSYGDSPLDHPFDAGSRMSGGQKKLFALTRCLLRDPTFLFLDEPTTGMGPLEKYPLIDVMRKACFGKTVVLVDHDIVWQSRFCDHFLVLHEGNIVQKGSAEELRSEAGLFRELYLEASQSSQQVG
jgi:ABC-type multidrug transport system fused ATPase/permease subunit